MVPRGKRNEQRPPTHRFYPSEKGRYRLGSGSGLGPVSLKSTSERKRATPTMTLTAARELIFYKGFRSRRSAFSQSTALCRNTRPDARSGSRVPGATWDETTFANTRRNSRSRRPDRTLKPYRGTQLSLTQVLSRPWRMPGKSPLWLRACLPYATCPSCAIVAQCRSRFQSRPALRSDHKPRREAARSY